MITQVFRLPLQGQNLAVGPAVATFKRDPRFDRSSSSLGDDVDNPSNRLGTVQRSTGAAENLNSLYILGCEMGEIKCAKRCAIDFDAIDENQYMIRLGPANEYGRICATRTGLHHVQSRHVTQSI